MAEAGALRPSDGANDAVTWYEPTGREPMTTEARPPATATVPVTAPENWTVPVGAGVEGVVVTVAVAVTLGRTTPGWAART